MRMNPARGAAAAAAAAEAYEAVLGAVYADGGFAAAEDVHGRVAPASSGGGGGGEGQVPA
jgi:dsRNA-specific ribonuclease